MPLDDEENVADNPAGADEPAPAVKPPPRPVIALDVLTPDEVEGDEDYDDDDDDEIRTVLITGASGNIGRKLREAWSGAYDLILVDRVAEPDDLEVNVADLSELSEEWTPLFHGVDTVIHLAANPDEHASWEDLEGPNLDTLFNVFHASALAGVDRLIFASSNHAMGGYRELIDMPITVELPPRPDGAYGATKLMGERLGRSLARAFDITFVALRIGWVQPGENRPETLPDDWSRGLWLSNGDMVRLFDCAVEADLDDDLFVVVNGTSNNQGSRWDMTVAHDWLGYTPEDDAFAEEL